MAEGPTIRGFLLFAIVSTALYLPFLWRTRRLLQLSILKDAVRGGRGATRVRVAAP
jgi:hypothetical protein